MSLVSSYKNKCFRQNCSEKQNTFCVQQLYFKNRAVYEIMWKHNLQRNKPQVTIWCMRI